MLCCAANSAQVCTKCIMANSCPADTYAADTCGDLPAGMFASHCAPCPGVSKQHPKGTTAPAASQNICACRDRGPDVGACRALATRTALRPNCLISMN